ncbi:hypothetical protein LA6_003576 [Marinibacterium anthonyi]|nr:hypothetical protein LA6_003576 [Marinibacterium anthonyi]
MKEVNVRGRCDKGARVVMDGWGGAAYVGGMRVWMAMMLAAPMALAGCETVKGVFDGSERDAAEASAGSGDTSAVQPQPRPDGEIPVSLPVSGNADLGTTVASLGDPSKPGLWMETPLTTREQTGQAFYSGSSVTLTLRPSGGAPGSGSRMSVLAMQALGAPLTELIEVRVTGAK